MSDLIQKGETLILPSSDPAVTVVHGYRRLLVGLDIAQSIDANAFAIILDERVPRWTTYAQELGPRRRVIVRAERIPQMSYMDLAQIVRNLMRDPNLAPNSYLVVDSGGVGRAFCDLLDARSVQHTRMQIVGGENESETKERGVTFNNVSKNLLLNGLNSSLHTGDLLIGDIGEARVELQNELESFEASIGTSGRMKIEGGTKTGHADIAMAAAMSYWLTDHRTVGAHIGEAPLKGFW
ncbi:MAG: hypothetical protein ABJL99_21050 [Aliishimia sp.]